MNDKYLIGEFSDMTGISKRMLRHYDKISLFSPIEINECNGYRCYGQEQIDDLDKIQFLRKLGFSLSSIGGILDNPIELDQFVELLKDKEVELTKESDEIKSSLLLNKRLIALVENHPTKTFPSIHKLLDWERCMTMKNSDKPLVDLKTLMNRDLFMERVEEIIEGDNNDSYHFVTFDIDFFMHVNDIDGFDVGDKVIQNVISIVINNMQPLLDESTYANFLARLGGDECSMFLKNSDHEKVIKQVTQAFEDVRAFDFAAIGCTRNITISCGVANGKKPDHYAKLKDESHKALMESKRYGRDQYVIRKY